MEGERKRSQASRRFKIENRMRVINGLTPPGFLKRRRFKRRLWRVLSNDQGIRE